MGIIRGLFNTALFGTAGGLGAFAFWTRNSKVTPLAASDAIFSSSAYAKYNPNKNAATQDICIKRVPLSAIKPQLLEKDGKLVEAFCAGVWGGLGYAYQRSYLEKKYKNDTTTAHQLWSRPELLSSTYEVGTQITDHFEVVSKDSEAIVVRCGDSPLKTEVRDSDGLFEMGVKVLKEEGVAEFRLKSVFYKGLGKADGKPMPAHVEFAHALYTKLWSEDDMFLLFPVLTLVMFLLIYFIRPHYFLTERTPLTVSGAMLKCFRAYKSLTGYFSGDGATEECGALRINQSVCSNLANIPFASFAL